MIALDTNIRASRGFAVSRSRLSARGRACRGAGSLGIPWPCLHEFLAIVTHPRIYAPLPLAQALDQMDAWLESPTLTLLAESTAHWPTLRALWSADGDFSRFSGLAW